MEKTRRKALLLLMVASTAVTPLAQAKVYKWVDAQGQTHYSATPPPPPPAAATESIAAEPTVEVEELAIGGRGAVSRNDSRVYGTYWGVLPETGQSVRYELNHGRFNLKEFSLNYSGVHEAVLAEGEYRVTGGVLEQSIFQRQDGELPTIGKSSQELLSVSEDRFSVFLETGHTVVYRKLTPRMESEFSVSVSGLWQDVSKNGWRIRFTDDDFSIYEKFSQYGSWKFVAAGQWSWTEPTMELDFVVNLREPVAHTRPQLKRWTLMKKRFDELEFRDEDGQQLVQLKRAK
ncbi:DUF4124 domain-containing protein [Allohahella marinimesophila]|uniref:DUF4124 domain-containing protein n=1 Tax=Allohahella marinimesophila TaxID=1054972 RepID=UPI0031E095FF